MYDFTPHEGMAWLIQGGLAAANVTLLILNVSPRSSCRCITLSRVVLRDQMVLLFVIALTLDILAIVRVFDTAVFGGAKALLYFRVCRAIYVGTLANLLLLLVNRSISSVRSMEKAT